jgi:hypothetical protein
MTILFSYKSRVFAHSITTNILCNISYVAENSHYKAAVYRYISHNTVLQVDVSVSEEISFYGYWFILYRFSDIVKSGVWKDSLVDPITGKFIRSRLRGVDYDYAF